jgi:outer membrane protein OmpA-like peptidoglycan-associated protein
MRGKQSLFILIFLGILSTSFGQVDTILVRNPSFEDSPRRGGAFPLPIRGWYDCGLLHFPSESPPDIHPVDFWSVTKDPSQGQTYLGMVVRYNDSWEAVSQRLSQSLIRGQCYRFEIDLAASPTYLSPTTANPKKEENFTQPAVLRIWGGNGICDESELLAESPTVTNEAWGRYAFEFKPRANYRFIILEAFYKTPNLFPYNGHILVDNGSNIIEISCEDEPQMIAKLLEQKKPEKKKKPEPELLTWKKPEKKRVEPIAKPPAVLKAPVSPKPKLLNLDRAEIITGQIIRIKNLYFEADTTSINKESYEVLDEIYDFLKENRDIVIEIGGHTNGLPAHKYCDILSKERAKAVYQYIVSNGISPNRVYFKGYGKRKPIASNHTPEGRAKNQRVEIKILSIDG